MQSLRLTRGGGGLWGPGGECESGSGVCAAVGGGHLIELAQGDG